MLEKNKIDIKKEIASIYRHAIQIESGGNLKIDVSQNKAIINFLFRPNPRRISRNLDKELSSMGKTTVRTSFTWKMERPESEIINRPLELGLDNLIFISWKFKEFKSDNY